jgi:nucleoside-diphosphate-sugar epimerase
VIPAVDAIVHLAQANTSGPSRSKDLIAVNVESTRALLKAAVRYGALQFLLASSGSVYGVSDEALDEDCPMKPSDEYSLSKARAEQMAEEFRDQLDVSVLRLFVPYGPGQTRRMIPTLADRIRQGTPVVLNEGGRPRVNPAYVDDVIDAVLASLGASGSRVINVAGPDVVDVRKLSNLIASTMSYEVRFTPGSSTVGGDIVASTTRLQTLIRRDLTPLADGLQRTFGAREA